MLYKLTWEEILERLANDSEAYGDFGHDPAYTPRDPCKFNKTDELITHILKGEM